MELNRLRSGTALVLVGKALMGAGGLVSTMLLTRLLGKEEVGAYFMLAQIVNVSRLFSEAGMNVGLQKLIGVALAEGDEAAVRRHAAAAAAVLLLSLSLLSGLLLFCWEPLTVHLLDAPAVAPLALLALPWLFGFSVEDLASVFFRSLHEMKAAVLWVGVPRQVAVLVGLGVVWLLGIPVDLKAMVALIAATWGVFGVVTGALVLWRVRRMASGPGPLPGAMGGLLTLSLPMLLHTGALLVMNSADIWVLQVARGSAEVGVYGAVAKVSVSMAFFVGAVNMVLPPMLARLNAQGELKEMEQLLRRSALWGAYLAVPMTAVFVFAGPLALSIAFTDAYAEGATALAITACAHCVNAVSGSPGFVLQMTGRHLFLMRLTLAVAALNLVGNIALVGPFGMNGVAFSTAFTLILQNVVMVWTVRKEVGVKTWAERPHLPGR